MTNRRTGFILSIVLFCAVSCFAVTAFAKVTMMDLPEIKWRKGLQMELLEQRFPDSSITKAATAAFGVLAVIVIGLAMIRGKPVSPSEFIEAISGTRRSLIYSGFALWFAFLPLWHYAGVRDTANDARRSYGYSIFNSVQQISAPTTSEGAAFLKWAKKVLPEKCTICFIFHGKQSDRDIIGYSLYPRNTYCSFGRDAPPEYVLVCNQKFDNEALRKLQSEAGVDDFIEYELVEKLNDYNFLMRRKN